MANASANKMFLTRCKNEGLPVYTKGMDAKQLLEGASVAATGSAADLRERAAVVVWARAHVGELLTEWEKLDDAAQACLIALYPGTKGAAGATPLARGRRAVRANMTPTLSPAKPAVAPVDDTGKDGLVDAPQAVAQATQAEKDKSGGGKSPGAAAGVGSSATSPDPFGLVRVDPVGSGADSFAESVAAGAARTAAPERQGGASKRLFPGGAGAGAARKRGLTPGGSTSSCPGGSWSTCCPRLAGTRWI